MPPKVDEQIAVLETIATELAAQTTAIQALTAAVQASAADTADALAITKFQAESLDHYVDYMTGPPTHVEPLP